MLFRSLSDQQLSLCHVRQSLPAYPHSLPLFFHACIPHHQLFPYSRFHYTFAHRSILTQFRIPQSFTVKLHQISKVSVSNGAGFLISQFYKPRWLISWEPYQTTYPVVNTFSISSFRVEPLEPSVVTFCRTALKQFARKIWLSRSHSSDRYSF